ncbi:hypothetical protein GOBAR_AA01123 [Gossypium barbadense]|uniref:Uncharacterized protein n=1 Tax=Gossypium barbadense TaxID=3634 RepID=A0A2P5YV47_GOSBA|nr:hypothetical protein GOBAR_AA01123 [Gossypium barbadense]
MVSEITLSFEPRVIGSIVKISFLRGLPPDYMLSSYFSMPGSSNLAEERRKRRIMEQDKLDYVLDPLKNGVLAVQTIRNNIMASTLLATIAITLSSLISVFVSSSSDSGNTSSEIVFGNKTRLLSSIKYFSILLCFLVAFLCNVQSIRYYAHVSFLVTLSSPIDDMETVEYVARNLNRGSYFWSLGLRAFYLSFSLLLWIFGPIPMFLCSCMMSFLLYFLDTTSSFTRQLHRHSFNENSLKADDLESVSLLS